MKGIRVIDLAGPICVGSDEGAKLFNWLRAALDCGETVCLDFSGVTVLAGSFLMGAVGSLYAFFGKDELDGRLRWKGLDPTHEGVMEIVQRNAIRFFSATPAQQEALLASSARAVGE